MLTARTKRTRRPLTIAMTPMIDVVFLLLIYFVCTASFTPPETVLAAALVEDQSSQGAAPTENTSRSERVVIAVESTSTGPRWTLNRRVAESPEELARVLAALVEIDRGLPVVLDVEPAVSVDAAVETYDRCLAAGFEKLQFAVPEQP